jgi:hypothetical protein
MANSVRAHEREGLLKAFADAKAAVAKAVGKS